MTATIPTLLVLTGMGIPPYSARGITQTYQPIGGASNMRRTVNGVLRDISDPLFQKYASTLTCSDMDVPAVDGVWPGMQLTVDWIQELCVQGEFEVSSEGDSDGSHLGRTPVPGSVRIADGFTFFRPRMSMLVTAYNVSRNEWQAVTGWSMSLEEV